MVCSVSGRKGLSDCLVVMGRIFCLSSFSLSSDIPRVGGMGLHRPNSAFGCFLSGFAGSAFSGFGAELKAAGITHCSRFRRINPCFAHIPLTKFSKTVSEFVDNFVGLLFDRLFCFGYYDFLVLTLTQFAKFSVTRGILWSSAHLEMSH